MRLLLALWFNRKYRFGWLAGRGWYGSGSFGWDEHGPYRLDGTKRTRLWRK